jgi:hypothetical protein
MYVYTIQVIFTSEALFIVFCAIISTFKLNVPAFHTELGIYIRIYTLYVFIYILTHHIYDYTSIRCIFICIFTLNVCIYTLYVYELHENWTFLPSIRNKVRLFIHTYISICRFHINLYFRYLYIYIYMYMKYCVI